jgi:pimeloyl-ACP methyl ester carboxylesterase
MRDLRFASVRLPTGPRIHFAEQGSDVARGSGSPRDPILFLHGWPDSWYSFSRVLELLPPHVHAVVPDQRGFGDSDKPDGEYTIETFATDAAALLDALSIERATLVGHSFGSFVARCLALNHPGRVARLVLIGTAVSAATPVVLEAHSVSQQLTDPVPEQFAREFQSGTVHVPLPPAFFDRIVSESLKLPARPWRAAIDAIVTYRDEDRLGRLSAPTLILWGEHDALFPREYQDRLKSAIPGARFISYADTGHCPNWERPERVTADLLNFLEN